VPFHQCSRLIIIISIIIISIIIIKLLLSERQEGKAVEVSNKATLFQVLGSTGQQTVVTLFRLTLLHTQPRILSRLLEQNLASSLSLSPCGAAAPPINPVTSGQQHKTRRSSLHNSVHPLITSSQIVIFL
jgi:ribosomal protein S28E/S33